MGLHTRSRTPARQSIATGDTSGKFTSVVWPAKPFSTTKTVEIQARSRDSPRGAQIQLEAGSVTILTILRAVFRNQVFPEVFRDRVHHPSNQGYGINAHDRFGVSTDARRARRVQPALRTPGRRSGAQAP